MLYIQDYAYRERNALNLLNARPWTPSDLTSSARDSSSSTSLARCNSIAEEDEEDDDDDVIGGSVSGGGGNLRSSLSKDDDLVFDNDENENSTVMMRHPAAADNQQQQQKQQQQQQQRRRNNSSCSTKNVRNPFFVELHSSFKTNERLFFVLTHAIHGEILHYLKVPHVCTIVTQTEPIWDNDASRMDGFTGGVFYRIARTRL